MQEFYRLILVQPSNSKPKIIPLSDTESSMLLKKNDQDTYKGSIVDSHHQIVKRNGQKIHFGIARLDSGAIQFYYNFRLVEIMTSDNYEQDLMSTCCVNIGIDFSNVYYRVAEKVSGGYRLTTYSSNFLMQPQIEKVIVNQTTLKLPSGLTFEEIKKELNEHYWSITDFSRQSMMS